MPDDATTHLANFLREKYHDHYFQHTDLALPISYQDAAAILRVAGFDELRSVHQSRLDSLQTLCQDAELKAGQERRNADNIQRLVDDALSVDGVTADDAPEGINGNISTVAAWLEGYEEGQNSICDVLEAAPATSSVIQERINGLQEDAIRRLIARIISASQSAMYVNKKVKTALEEALTR